jgi:arylsulfatase A-like enzyme
MEAAMVARTRRVLIVGFDGMRPDLVTADLMPALSGLIARGTRLSEHHAVYPSETRVNMSSLASGTTPGRHGVVANVMRIAGATDDGIIDTSDYRHIEALDRASGGRAILVPTLADLLAERGRRLAVAATSTPGAAFLWTRTRPYRLVNTHSAYGRADLYALRDKLGEVPAVDAPSREHLMYAARAVTDLYLDDDEIAVIVLWLSEPDSALHLHGLGTPQVAEALRACDAALAHVLAGIERRGLTDQFDCFLISDHGHSSVEAHRSLGEQLDQARADLGTVPNVTTASDLIYPAPGAPTPTARELAPLVAWIQEQPWAGAVFGGTPEVARLPGVLPLAALWNGIDHERAPLLIVSPAWSDAPNAHGVPGTVAALTAQGALRSTHGSASPYDLHAFATAIGPDFRAGVVSTLPSGGIDLAPTILTLLGIAVPAWMDGRVLWEAFRQPTGEPGASETLEIGPGTPHPDGFAPILTLHRVGTTSYVHAVTNGRAG